MHKISSYRTVITVRLHCKTLTTWADWGKNRRLFLKEDSTCFKTIVLQRLRKVLYISPR